MTFAFPQIVLTAVIGAVASVVVLLVDRRRRSEPPGLDWAVGPSLVVGLSILLWRTAGNVPALNDDPIPFISPNDVLCPVLTYVALALYGAIGGIDSDPGWRRRAAALTLLSLAVNVVTI